MRVSPFAKAIVAALGAVAAVAVPLISESDVLTAADFTQMGLAVVTAVLVYVVPNLTPRPEASTSAPPTEPMRAVPRPRGEPNGVADHARHRSRE